MKDREAFCSLIVLLCETFGRPASGGALEGYWIALQDLDEADLKRAIHKLLKTSRFMPVPAQIRDAAGAGNSLEVRAAEAWKLVRPLISESGGAVKDPVSSRVVEALGGWEALGNRSVEENSTWTRKEFIALYKEYSQNSKRLRLGECEELKDLTSEVVKELCE